MGFREFNLTLTLIQNNNIYIVFILRLVMGTYSGCSRYQIEGVAGKGERRKEQKKAEVKRSGGNQWCSKPIS